MPKGSRRDHIEIQVLGEWSVTRDGEDATIGPNTEAILHALVMGHGEATREQLEAVLPEPHRPRRNVGTAVANALLDLRRKDKFNLSVRRGKDPVIMSRDQKWATVDLWEFFKLVDVGEYAQAAELISGGKAPVPLVKDAHHNSFWDETIAKFTDAKARVLEAIEASTGRNRMMLDVRARLLDRALVPGVGFQASIEQVRGALEPMTIPWRLLRPDRGLKREPLPAFLADELSRGSSRRRLIVVGGHGAGKTLAAIATFLRLTDALEDGKASAGVRPVLYADGYSEGQEEGFATDSWLQRALRESQATRRGRPIVVMSHAEAFFSRTNRSLHEILNWRMFRDSDVLLCCSKTFYEHGLRYEDYGNCVVELEPWGAEEQRAFATAVFDEETASAFDAWRDADETGTRAGLCAVPLHLSFLLPMVGYNPAALARISTRWHLFDQVARMRLRAARQGTNESRRMAELAALAHRFHVPDMPPDRPIGFNLDELEDFLRQRNPRQVRARRDGLIADTLIAPPAPGSDEYHFEDPAWGWFFAAMHLVQLLKGGATSEDVLRAFAQELSPEVATLCEEMLCESYPRYEEQIDTSLATALEGDVPELAKARCRVAKKQVRQLSKAVSG